MAIRPRAGEGVVIVGDFSFVATHASCGQVNDTFTLEITVPRRFPKELPKVLELGGRIPRQPKFHINKDSTLCLGSPLALLMILQEESNLIGFADRCLTPYLFAISRRLEGADEMSFGELRHGQEGILDDCMRIFSLPSRAQAEAAFKLLALHPRVANKRPCPCRCGHRLGRCEFRQTLRSLRSLNKRSWFRAQEIHLK